MFAKLLGFFTVGISLLPFFAQPVFAQTSGEFQTLLKEIRNLKANQARIQKELREIKGLLQKQRTRPAPFKPVVVSIADEPVKGEKNATLTLIDFSDYQ
jgi:t-SNARE complex subunit (syntaxin)